MANRIVLNETSYFGAGSIHAIPEEVKRRQFKKALVVTDKDLLKFNVAQKVTAVLEEAQIPYEIYDNVKQNPTIENVQSGVKKFAEEKADFLIAIGGGSSIDTAKGIGIVTNNPEFSDVKSLEGVADTKNKSVPIIAVATTAGTAAEVTINYVITDEIAVKKMVCVDPNDIPIVAIIDPELMTSMPKSLTAATGMDALTHAIEGYITKGAWVLTDMFELKAIELITKHLEKAVFEPANIEARDGMGTAQYIAGMGFSNVGLGIVHSMAHSLGAVYDTPHGVANALLLPYVMEYNASATGEKYREIARNMNVEGVDTMSPEEYRKAAVNAVVTLSKKIGIPQKLVEIGGKEEDLPRLAKMAYQDVCTPGNPKDTNEAEILEIYKKAFQ
ncbi:lactaldehyde reductase [Pelosinus fermentans]|uniref:Lactaldehyde reductase n=1 Tax=Pelosinus fermentans B4 TaxID=1149862 RepID=I8RJE5_9FIRM|nr:MULTISPECIES: lactaldehyde reductase [Pelosinus]EIW20138.1 lactaldehyde reductase [Pelosinus fermentans B4]OAM93056.1 lactaldehyde reductase [Pelosinus fermentans DSM 17108]SDQ65513.1 lactaldehyde reductase [Pelosinus fermentans]